MTKKILYIITLALFLVSCSSSPASVAEKFSENIAHGKYEEAKAYCTEPTSKMLEMASGVGALTGEPTVNPDFEFNLLSEEIDGKRATVVFKDEKGEENSLDLVEIDGKWLVNMELNK